MFMYSIDSDDINWMLEMLGMSNQVMELQDLKTAAAKATQEYNRSGLGDLFNKVRNMTPIAATGQVNIPNPLLHANNLFQPDLVMVRDDQGKHLMAHPASMLSGGKGKGQGGGCGEGAVGGTSGGVSGAKGGAELDPDQKLKVFNSKEKARTLLEKVHITSYKAVVC